MRKAVSLTKNDFGYRVTLPGMEFGAAETHLRVLTYLLLTRAGMPAPEPKTQVHALFPDADDYFELQWEVRSRTSGLLGRANTRAEAWRIAAEACPYELENLQRMLTALG